MQNLKFVYGGADYNRFLSSLKQTTTWLQCAHEESQFLIYCTIPFQWVLINEVTSYPFTPYDECAIKNLLFSGLDCWRVRSHICAPAMEVRTANNHPSTHTHTHPSLPPVKLKARAYSVLRTCRISRETESN